MTEIIPNIYGLSLSPPNDPLAYVNTYLVRGDNKCLLIDAGWDTEETLNSLKEQLAEIDTHLEDISQIVATHIHPDHYGLAGRLKQLSQAKIALHYLETELLKSSYSDILKLIQQGVEQAYINGVPADVVSQVLSQMRATRPEMMKLAAPVLPDTMLHGGETISFGSFSFKVLWTPGHSPGHVCLYEPIQEILITGDHILPTITPDVNLEPNSGPNPLDDYLNSLNEIKQLKVSLVLPGHRQPFTNLPQRIEEIIQNYKQRSSEILEAVKAEAKTAYQISTEMTWIINMKPVSSQDMGPWERRLAFLKTLAHLESMRFKGKVDKFLKDNIVYYQST